MIQFLVVDSNENGKGKGKGNTVSFSIPFSAFVYTVKTPLINP